MVLAASIYTCSKSLSRSFISSYSIVAFAWADITARDWCAGVSYPSQRPVYTVVNKYQHKFNVWADSLIVALWLEFAFLKFALWKKEYVHYLFTDLWKHLNKSTTGALPHTTVWSRKTTSTFLHNTRVTSNPLFFQDISCAILGQFHRLMKISGFSLFIIGTYLIEATHGIWLPFSNQTCSLSCCLWVVLIHS